MKKVLLFVFISIVLIGCGGRGHDTLEEAVQSKWETKIEVINQDMANQLVYYLDVDQHVIGTYEYKDGKYFYDNKQSEGMSFTSDNGIPFYIQYKHFDGAGDIVYGAISSDEHQVDRFVIFYKNGEYQEIEAVNNTFMAEVPPTMDPRDLMSKIEAAYGLDENGEIIEGVEY